jgi:hypothetical protein
MQQNEVVEWEVYQKLMEKFMKVANFFRFSTLFDIEKAPSTD